MHDTLGRLVPDGIRGSYLRQFGAIVVLILVLLALVLGGVNSAIAADERESVRSSLTSDVGANADAVDDWHGERMGQVRLLADVVGDSDSIASTLNRMGPRFPADVVGLHYVDLESGSIVETSGAETTTEWIGDASAHETTMTDSFRSDDRAHVAFVEPLASDPGMAVAMTVDLNRSFDFRSSVAGSAVSVVDRENQILVGDDGTAAGAFDGPEAAINNASATAEIHRGDDGALNAAQSTGGRLVLVQSIPASAYGVGWDTYRYYVIIFVLVAASLGGVGLTMTRPTARSVNRLVERAEAIEEGDLSADLETSRIDEIGRLFESFDNMRTTLKRRMDEIESAREEARADAEQAREAAEEARREAERFNEHLEATADEYSSVLEQVAGGDLTRRLDPDDESEAMREVAEVVNATLDELEGTVAQVERFADDVVATSVETAEQTAEVRETSERVSDSLREIAADAAEQDATLQEVYDELNTLSASVEEIAASADQVESLAEQTAATASAGREDAAGAIAEMESVEDAADDAVADIRSLSRQMEAVADTVSVIDDIAEQTNVLALNASIEAARAGESGEGFAVVAQEVKGLAEDTQEATTEIQQANQELLSAAASAVEAIEGVRDDVAEGVEAVTDVGDALEDIAENAGETSHGVEEISQATGDGADAAEAVVSMAEDVAAIGERTNERAQAVTDDARAQVVSLDDVSEEAGTLQRQARELQGTLDEFTVRHGADPDGNDPAVVPVDDGDAEPAPAGDSDGPERETRELAVLEAEERDLDVPAEEEDALDVPDDAETELRTPGDEPDDESAVEN